MAAGGIEHGIEWMTSWSPMGLGLNGYVSIPKDHVLYGVHYDDENWDAVDSRVYFPGGCTFSQQGTTPDSWWLGFDTAHGFDYWPGGLWGPAKGMTAWSFETVNEITRLIARQVAYDPEASGLIDTLMKRIVIK